MTLKHLANQKILTDVIGACEGGKWKVLVLDHLGMRIISSCCQLNEIVSKGIALLEDITRKREPLRSLEAIYLISPIKSLKLLMNDFEHEKDKNLYDSAHVFFTSACPDDLFAELQTSNAAKYIKTLKEINTAFVPYESKVFSLDSSTDVFPALFSSTKKALEECADQLATVCATLGEYPRISFRTDVEGLNVRFATLVQQKLDFYKTIEPNMKDGRTQLLIVDRGFDCVTPVLHDLTFQSMIYDLLEVKNDSFRYKDKGEEKELLFGEHARLWTEFRHQHIAVVNSNLPGRVRQFNAENKLMETSQEEHVDIKHLAKIVKNLPKYQKEKSEYVAYMQVTEDCMNRYSTYVNQMCLVEQDIAMGTDVQGEPLGDAHKNKKVFPLFLDSHILTYDKIRMIMLFILSKNGITEQNLQILLQHAKIPEKDQTIITNLKQLGIDMDPARRNVGYPRKNRIDDDTYDTARWTPVLKDIMEDAVEDKLNAKHFQSFSDNIDKPKVAKAAPMSLRFGGGQNANQARPNPKSGVSRLIVYVLGGLTYSEMRCAYEVSKATNCDIIIGSDQIMTPTSFLENLRQLSN